MLFLKRQLPLVICFIMGLLFAIQYYVPHELSEKFLTEMNDWMIVLGAFATILAVMSLCRVHWEKVRKKSGGYGFSVVVFVSMGVTIVLGFISEGKVMRENILTSFGWIYNHMLVPLQGTMFSILAFFIASAAFRAFRARTKEAFCLLLAALIIMFGRVPLGEFIWAKLFGLKFPVQMGDITEWIMNVLNMAARRGIMLGVALGVIATSLKIIFGIERTYLGGEK